ncbi:MAG: hypothetical protein ACR2NI_06345, partial [Pirellulales bacterium]
VLVYGFQLLRQGLIYLVKRCWLSSAEAPKLGFKGLDLMIAIAAHLIVVPFLWAFDYDRDPESIAECHDCINIQAKEAEDENLFSFLFDTSE